MILRTHMTRCVLLAATALILLGACDRNKTSAPEESPTNPAEAPRAPVAEVAPYVEPEPGSLSPEDLGPEAPAVFFLSGLKGYTEPCGCTSDVLLGGIDRISGFVEAARALHPAVAMVDGGDMLFYEKNLDDHMHPQERAKADVIIAAHRAMGTLVTVPGERDFALGTDFYLEKMKEAGITPIAVNLSIAGTALTGYRVETLGDVTVAFLGAVQPELYEDIPGISVEEADRLLGRALEAVREATTRVLIFHGDLGAAKNLLEAHDRIDFAIIGHNPRETDQVDAAGHGHTLEAYDQGRYLGVLKLYDQHHDEGNVNALGGSDAERVTVERQIEHVGQSLARVMEAAEGGEAPPMAARLKERLSGLEERLEAMKGARVDVPEDRRAFVYRPVPMLPGYPHDEEITELRLAFNRSLRELSADIERDPLPVVEGQPFFVGNQECALCHAAATTFWETTDHSRAVATLAVRDKDFDQNCIGCHVVGWEQPGGSVLGKLQYEAQLGDHTIQKDLRNVGCEACHGPGSEHRLAPLDASGAPQHIIRKPTVDQCTQCHVPEHSPHFDFDNYVRRVTGEGHQYSGVH